MKTNKPIFNGKFILTLIRVAIGWHFLYEGASKLLAREWSSYSYLINTRGPLSGFYHGLASSDALVKVVDILNVYGLILIGLGLFLGILIRYASVAGVMLLMLYYFAYPPLGASVFSQNEGSFYLVNKVLVEALVLAFFILNKETGFGMSYFRNYFRKKKTTKPDEPKETEEAPANSRREALKNIATLPALGVLGFSAFQHQEKYNLDVMSGATIQIKQTALSELKGTLPKGKVGNHEISRLVAGGNLIGGWSHARDLIYVSSLMKAYNTEKKVYETLMLAEQAGINTINIGFTSNPLMAKYKKMFGSKIKVISQVAPNMDKRDYFREMNMAMDYGADILQVQGNWCDWLVRDKKLDVIEKMLSRIREQGYTAGLAAHTVDSLIICEENGIIPDYYMKTMHHDKYWSAHPVENRVPFEVDGKENLDHNKYHNNMFCLFPERTAEFVNRTKVPVMGFKVLAAGAIEPRDGFRWAFENGADMICVGMFDYQLVENVNQCLDILADLPKRQRPWFA